MKSLKYSVVVTVSVSFILVFATFAFVGISPSFGHKAASGVVKERMELMERYDELLDRLFAVAHGDIPASADIIRKVAKEIHETAGDHLVSLFPEGSTQAPSEARPTIWKDMTFFRHLSDRLEDFAEELEDSASGQPIKVFALPKKWEDVPAMGQMMQQGQMMGQGGMMMGRQSVPSFSGSVMEQNIWRVAHVCNTCHLQFREQK